MAKAKALFSCAVTAQLICVFVFVYAKKRFSHDAAHIQLMHSFEVKIRICQPEKVMSIEASAHNLYVRA